MAVGILILILPWLNVINLILFIQCLRRGRMKQGAALLTLLLPVIVLFFHRILFPAGGGHLSGLNYFMSFSPATTISFLIFLYNVGNRKPERRNYYRDKEED